MELTEKQKKEIKEAQAEIATGLGILGKIEGLDVETPEQARAYQKLKAAIANQDKGTDEVVR